MLSLLVLVLVPMAGTMVLGKYHLIREQVEFGRAASACQAKGLQLAMAYDSTIDALLSVFKGSNSTTAWIKGLNGNADNACMMIERAGRIVGAIQDCSSRGTAAVICQNINTITTVMWSTTTRTITHGTKTSTMSRPPFIFNKPKNNKLMPDENHPDFNEGYPFVELGFFKMFPSSDPAYCATYGWTFADVTSNDVSMLSEMFVDSFIESNVWINSFNGLSGKGCTFINVTRLVFDSVMFNMDTNLCTGANIMLCLEQPAKEYIFSTWTPSVHVATVSQVETVTVTVPKTTRSVAGHGQKPTPK